MRYGLFLVICLFVALPVDALERPDTSFKISQLPADMIPRVAFLAQDPAIEPAFIDFVQG
ncbi:MAG: hypothetical protein ACI906_004906 [Candidatus Latescibacterota bacterium]|jgi:hypothetical protein